jgi:hypothetical protein
MVTGGDRGGFRHALVGAWSLLALLVLVAGAGCVRDVVDEDCKELGRHLHEVWTAEAKFPATASPSAEKAVAVIKSEGAEL